MVLLMNGNIGNIIIYHDCCVNSNNDILKTLDDDNTSSVGTDEGG